MGNLLLDASSPAIVYTDVGATVTTASFTPPANSLVVVLFSGNNGSGNTPTVPVIADSLGPDLAYTLHHHSARPDSPTTDGQAAIWSAPNPTSNAMTISITNGDPATGTAIKVMVFTDDSGGTPTIGATKENGSTATTAAKTDSVTGTITGSRGVLMYTDWTANGVPTAGTDCTLTGGGAANQGAISYAFVLRTTADGVAASSITMNWSQTAGSATHRWVIVEVCPTAGAAAPKVGMPTIYRWPGDGPFPADRFTPQVYSTEVAPVVDVSVNAESTTHAHVAEAATVTATTTDTTAPALTHQAHDTTTSVAQTSTDVTSPALDHQAQPVTATSTTTDTVAPAVAHQSLDATISVAQSVTDGTAPVITHQAFDATVSTAVILNVNAGDTATTHQAEGVTATIAISAQDTATVHQALNAATTVAQTGVDLTGPALVHQTQQPTTSLTITDPVAPVITHQAHPAGVTSTTLAGETITTHQAHDATVSMVVLVNVTAGETITTHQAFNATIQIAVSAPLSDISHQTFAPDVTQPPGDQNVTAEPAAITHQAFGATWSIAPSDQGVSNTHQAQSVTSTQTTLSGTTQGNLVAYNATINTRSAGTAYIGVDTGLGWASNHDGHAVGSSPDRDTLTVGASLEPAPTGASSLDGHSHAGPTTE